MSHYSIKKLHQLLLMFNWFIRSIKNNPYKILVKKNGTKGTLDAQI